MSYEKMKKNFIAPSTAYRSLPFWAWNDSLCAEELVLGAIKIFFIFS